MYLEKQGEVGRGKGKKVLYKRAKDDRVSFISVEDIFETNVDVSDNLTINMDEYTNILQIV